MLRRGSETQGGGNSHRSGYVIDTGLTRVLSRIDTILPAFNKAVTQYMVALFFMLLTVGVGEAWGTTYYNLHIIAVDENGAETSQGVVFACQANQWAANKFYRDSTHLFAPEVETGPWTQSSLVSSVYRAYVHLYASPSDLASFAGWYYDTNFQNPVHSKAKTNGNPNTNFTLYYDEILSEEENSPTDITIYAKFSVTPASHYYARLNFDESAEAKRKVAMYESLGVYKYALQLDQDAESYNASHTFSYTRQLVVKRGYKFLYSTLTGGAFASSGDANIQNPTINIASNNTSSATPATATLTPVSDTIVADTLFISKDANRGRIKHYYQNYIENVAGDGLESKKVFEEMASSELTKKYLSYRTDTRIALKAIPEANYSFQGWYKVDEEGNKTLFSTNDSLVISSSRSDTLYAYFSKAIDPNDEYIVGQTGCATFADAIAVATSAPDNKVIRPRKENVTIPAGNYTIPAGVTLLIPYAAEQETPDVSVRRTSTESIDPMSAYRILTLADGAHLNVYGNIEVGGKQCAGREGAGGDVGMARTAGPTYGHMIMQPGSKITLNNGAVLRAWGYVTGDGTQDENGKYLSGEIDALRGATVFEHFQIMDWKGVFNTKKMWQDGNQATYMVLPISQYYIQNVEVPTKYRPGAKLKAALAINLGFPIGFVAKDDAGIIGVKYSKDAHLENPNLEDDKAIFLMDNEDDSEDTWVRKSYDVANDQQLYEANNAAYIGSLVIDMVLMGENQHIDSREYILPITNNFKIHSLSGNMEVTQKTELLPGAEIEVNKKSTLTINEGQSLYLYDAAQWGLYVSGIHNYDTKEYTFTYGTRVKYRPGGVPEVRNISTREGQGNAKLTVHGTVDVKGYLKTTEGGASITSTKADAGTILFSKAAPSIGYAHEDTIFKSIDVTPTYEGQHIISGLLSNESGSKYGAFSTTAETPAGKAFTFIDMDGDGIGEWISMSQSNCFYYDNYGIYYIKPQAYVPISNGMPEEEQDHTYRDHYAGTNKIYINVECDWWEVESVEGQPGVFHCIHPQNNTYYCYDNDGEVWVEKKYNVYWLNYDGDTLKFTNKYGLEQDHYELKHGTMPQWLSENPTRAEDANYSYTFNGWKPELASVTDSVTYVAQYTATPRQFIITFKDASGVEIETKLCEYGTIPTPTAPITSGYEWNPAISIVTGNQVYQEEAIPAETPASYTISFVNWDGTSLKVYDQEEGENAKVAINTQPVAPTDPTKAADALYTYSFAGWKAADGNTYTSDAIPSATANAIYTATYNKADKTYTIRFFKEGTTNETKNVEGNLLYTAENVAYGAVPAYNGPAQTAAAKTENDHTIYTLVWSPLVSAATADADYIASFTSELEQYTITFKNGDGVLQTKYMHYGETPAYYGATPTKEDAENFYTFTGWDEAISPVSEDKVYTAQFSVTPKVTSLTVDKDHPQTPTTGQIVQATTVTIAPNGSVDLSATNTKLMADNLILESLGTTSGQIIAGANSQVAVTNAYFDLKVDVKTHKWYAIAVPWHVNAETGISVNGRTLEFGKDFDILYYDGAARAANGANGSAWKYLEDTYGKGYRILQPGTLYMIGLMMDAPNGIRFKKTGGALLTSSVEVNKYTESTANDGKDANWNGIANPALFYAYLNEGGSAHVAQSYNPADDNYTEINLSTTPLVVGQPVFVQAPAAKTVVAYTSNTNYASHAPRRAAAEENAFYTLEITRDNQLQGRLFVATVEEKEDHYVIGQDVLKMGISKNKAQLWINRYDAKLCMNTQSLTNGVAEYPLSIYAPANGEYTISVQNSVFSDQYSVYLTLDGQAIWNLTDGAYTLMLDKGTATNYGLRISARAPQTATGTDEAIIDAKGETKKVLINDKVYIIRGNEVYTIDGRKVK